MNENESNITDFERVKAEECKKAFEEWCRGGRPYGMPVDAIDVIWGEAADDNKFSRRGPINILISEIEAYFETNVTARLSDESRSSDDTPPDNDEEYKATAVQFKSGNVRLIAMPYDSFTKIINDQFTERKFWDTYGREFWEKMDIRLASIKV